MTPALIGNLGFVEIVLIGIAAVLIFGKRLPEVAGQAARGIGQARRALEELWRESGLEREVDEVRRQVDDARRAMPRLDPGKRVARSMIERATKAAADEPGSGPKPELQPLREPWREVEAEPPGAERPAEAEPRAEPRADEDAPPSGPPRGPSDDPR